MSKKNYSDEQEKIARFAKAMGHPARIAILQFLAEQECCFFGDIHEELPIAKATVSQHLKELKDAGLIQGEIEAPKVRYCINKENWEIAQKMFAGFFGQPICKKRVAVNKQTLFLPTLFVVLRITNNKILKSYEKDFISYVCMSDGSIMQPEF